MTQAIKGAWCLDSYKSAGKDPHAQACWFHNFLSQFSKSPSLQKLLSILYQKATAKAILP